MNAHVKLTITPRINLDFNLAGTAIARYWYEDDPFKTRFMEAIFASFPPGERYFMTSVRHFKERVQDVELQQDIQAFNRQEAQHGIVHSQFNDLVEKNGAPIAEVDARQVRRVNKASRRLSPEFNLAITAAAEHFTSLMADAFYGDTKVLSRVDHRIRAMLAWHAMEEMEHKAVAFDVMQKVAKVGYSTRIQAMFVFSVAFLTYRTLDTNMLLKSDGFNRRERIALISKGLWWAFGWKGVISSHVLTYASYFRPGFHPNDMPIFPQYQRWLEVYEQTGDAIAAGESLFA